ncbi:MAG TPA: phosphatidylinositol mannoside acyltransferase [Egibacteraceae bacterium]|nr:phosphatidylinositol mannoside acyltransferase [Egibacteraceae bacterium]
MSYRGTGVPGVPVDRNPGAADRIPPDPRPEPLRLRLTGWLYVAVWEAARRLPESWAHALAQAAARWMLRRRGPAQERLRRNLARVVPADELDDTVAEAFRSYARYWVEAFRAADLSAHDVDRRTTSTGFDKLDAVLEQGRGAIVLLAHHGSWDVAAQWGETHGYHLAVVAELLRPRAVFRRFVRLREAIGLEVVPLRRGDDMVGRLTEVLAANHMVGLLSERDLTGKGPVVDFFGEPARVPPGPVVLSQRTGVPIVPAVLLQRPGLRWHFEILDPFDVEGMTVAEGCQRLAHALEDIIRTDPAQWHAFQPVWLADLPPRHGPDKRGDWRPPDGASGAAS